MAVNTGLRNYAICDLAIDSFSVIACVSCFMQYL